MCVNRLKSSCLPKIFMKNFHHLWSTSLYVGLLSKSKMPFRNTYAMFSSSIHRNSDGGDFSNPVQKILSNCPHNIKQKKKFRDTLVLEGVKFYLDKGLFKESASFFAEQVELYQSVNGVNLLLDFCLQSYKNDSSYIGTAEKQENMKQNTMPDGKSVQKICCHRVKKICDICSNYLNTSEFIAHLVASMIINGFYKDALVFMKTFSLSKAFSKPLFLWKKQRDLKSIEIFAELLEDVYFKPDTESYFPDIELKCLLDIWKKRKFKSKKGNRNSVKPQKLDAMNVDKMLKLFVDCWAEAARQDSDSLAKLRIFLAKTSSDLIATKKMELEKNLNKKLQLHSKEVEQKKEYFKRAHDEFLSELVENYIPSERVDMQKKIIKQKAAEVESHTEAVSKKLEIDDNLAKKHNRITAERVASGESCSAD